jgi:hypothetical protein
MRNTGEKCSAPDTRQRNARNDRFNAISKSLKDSTANRDFFASASASVTKASLAAGDASDK